MVQIDPWSQDVMLGASLAKVYLLPLIGQAHIAFQCHSDVEDFCKIPSRIAIAWHNINDTAGENNWETILRPACRASIILAYIIPILLILLASNISLPLIQCCRRLQK